MAPPTLFLGESEHSIDDKFRLAVPARFRTALHGGLVITRGLERCLVIWDVDSWQIQAQQILSLNPWQSDARTLQRHFFPFANTAQPDKLGRIVIPVSLREYAQLDTDVVVAGMGNRIEVWSRSEWQRVRVEAERNSAALAEHLAAPGTPVQSAADRGQGARGLGQSDKD